MKNLFKGFFLAFFVLFFFSGLKAEEISFNTGSYSEVLKKAKTENKIIMADFYTDWCIWCKQLDMKVYTDPTTADYANKNQVNWKTDAEKGEGIDLAKKFNIKAFPTIVFINGDGEEVDRFVGYVPAAEFFPIMKGIVDGSMTINHLKEALAKKKNDVKISYDLAQKYEGLGMGKEAETLYKAIIKKDPFNTTGYTDDAELQLAIDNDKIDEVKTLLAKYPATNMQKDAALYLFNKSQEQADESVTLGYLNDLLDNYGTDEMVRFYIGQYYAAKANKIMKDPAAADEDRRIALGLADKALEYLSGGIFEASPNNSKSELYYQLKDKENALVYIDKALSIWDKKVYREQKEKIEKL
ncbi:hypothetical protein BH10BAC5_BH10BAC5_10850 [soil metagenome]